MKILHAADIHLGRRRLEGKLPDDDFAAALSEIVKEALQEKADVFLLAGDFFDSSQIGPTTLQQAAACLEPLRRAGIPAVAIEGNHDKTSIHSTSKSWMRYLSDEGYVNLLSSPFFPEGPLLTPWNEETRSGSWIDIRGVRFAGAGYLGAGTPKRVRAILERLPDDLPLALLLHAGPDYFVGEGGGFSSEDLAFMKERVSYLALGHIHKPMVYEGWACNPGSPENCRLEEARYDKDSSGTVRGRGYALVELDESAQGPAKSIVVKSNPRRPVFIFELDCTSFGNKLKGGPEALEEAAAGTIAAGGVPAGAAVLLYLTGAFNLARIGLDREVLAARLEESCGLAAVEVSTERMLFFLGRSAASGAECVMQGREELERGVVLEILQGSPIAGLEERLPELAGLFINLKEQVRNESGPDEIAELVLNHPLLRDLFEKRKAARAESAAESTESGSAGK